MQRKRNRRIRKIIPILFIVILVLVLIKYFGSSISNALLSLYSQSGNQTFISPSFGDKKDREIIDKLKKRDIIVQNYSNGPNPDEIVTVLDSGTQVIFSKDKDIGWQITSLESLLLRLNLDHKKPVKIDFTFQKPIVNF